MHPATRSARPERVPFRPRRCFGHFIFVTPSRSRRIVCGGHHTAHAGMPQFKLDVAQIEDLIAYLKSLER